MKTKKNELDENTCPLLQFSNIVLDYAGFNPDDSNLAIKSSKSKIETSNKFFLYKIYLINIFGIHNSKSSWSQFYFIMCIIMLKWILQNSKFVT